MKNKTKTICIVFRFKARGMDVGDAEANLAAGDDSGEDEAYDDDGEDIDLIRAKEAQIERPLCTVNMDDIKSKFESGHTQSREERREERKQEIQSIRSRLFMGKQAKIKEMYQQAVADSEQRTLKTDSISMVHASKTHLFSCSLLLCVCVYACLCFSVCIYDINVAYSHFSI